jgi:hypothetical protein
VIRVAAASSERTGTLAINSREASPSLVSVKLGGVARLTRIKVR